MSIIHKVFNYCALKTQTVYVIILLIIYIMFIIHTIDCSLAAYILKMCTIFPFREHFIKYLVMAFNVEIAGSQQSFLTPNVQCTP